MLKFYWNGIKENGGELQRAWYSLGNLINYPADTITIYGRDYKSFSDEVQKSFTVKNDSDMRADYCEKDRIRVTTDHPLYKQVFAAYEAHKAHCERQSAKWKERMGIAA